MELVEGECFPLGALLAHRPVASVYRAGKDTFCYELPVADFHTLLGMSAPFRDFCTRRIANLLEHSKQVIQAQYTQSGAEQQSLTSPLSAIIRRAPVTCSPQTTVGEVLQLMHASRIGSMVAVDDAGRPLGYPDPARCAGAHRTAADRSGATGDRRDDHQADFTAAAGIGLRGGIDDGQAWVPSCAGGRERATGRAGLGEGPVRFATRGLAPDRFRHSPCAAAGRIAAGRRRYPQHGAQHDGARRGGGTVDAVHLHLQRPAHGARGRTGMCGQRPRETALADVCAGWHWVRKGASSRP